MQHCCLLPSHAVANRPIRALAVREAEGKNAAPTFAIVDSRSVKTTEFCWSGFPVTRLDHAVRSATMRLIGSRDQSIRPLYSQG